MKIDELKEKLNKTVSKEFIPYFFYTGTIMGGYNIDKVDKFWRFYLCEDKGEISDMHYFTTEEELCEYVYNYVVGDYKRFIENIKKREKIEKNIEHIPEPPKVIYLGNDNLEKK